MAQLDELEIARLTNLLSGALLTQMVSAAAALGVADALGGRSASSVELAELCGANADSLRRLLRGLGSVGVIEELEPDLFALTDMGHLLRTDHPRSLCSWAIDQGALMAPLWSGLTSAVRTGRSAAEEVFGRRFYDHLAAHPDVDAHWNQAMAKTSAAWFDDAALLDVIDWSTVHCVVDVGGGHGALLALLLQRQPHLAGVLYDLPHVAAGAAAVLEKAGVADRAEIVGGDMFESVPTGGNLYLLARVVFNWDDDAALRLLRVCRHAMPSGARLLIIDQVVPEHGLAHPSKINDLALLAIGGRARDPTEWQRLAVAAHLRLAPAPDPSTLDPWVALVLECD